MVCVCVCVFMWTVKSWSREEWLSNRTAETIVYQPPYANVCIHCTWILGLVLGMFCIPNGLEYQGLWMPAKHRRPIQTLWWRKSWFWRGGHNNFRWDNWTALFLQLGAGEHNLCELDVALRLVQIVFHGTATTQSCSRGQYGVPLKSNQCWYTV